MKLFTNVAIDFGSNTFQLLVKNKLTDAVLINQSFSVKLLFDTEKKHYLSDKAILRAKKAIHEMLLLIAPFEVQQLVIVATSAFREAHNGSELADELFALFPDHSYKNKKCQVIEGNQEAIYIAKAQFNHFEFSNENFLIIDIGGGSVEFAFKNNSSEIKYLSIPFGVARIISNFQIDFQEKFDQNIIEKIENYLNPALAFITTLTQPLQLIGVGGAFETDVKLLGHDTQKHLQLTIGVAEFQSIHDKLLNTTHEERMQMDVIPLIRKDMILIANLIINCVLKLNTFEKMSYSSFDLKFGLID